MGRAVIAVPADLAVIGLGHLGLPLAQAAVAAGIDTIGYDTDPRPVAELAAGHSPLDGPLTASDVRRMLSGASGRPPTRPISAGSVPPSSARPPRSVPTAPPI